MSVYLQFDSSTRSHPYIQIGGDWQPNDDYANGANPVYQSNRRAIQTPANYRVFYSELNQTNNKRTIGFLAHCKERPVNLTYSVECCTVIIPASAQVERTDDDGNVYYDSVLDEPYIYVRMMPINNSEGDLIYSNNPPANEATFIVWLDKIQSGPADASPPAPPTEVTRPPADVALTDLTEAKWLIYKTCMVTVMRLNVDADEWQIRLYDRHGNDLVIPESDNGGVGFETEPDVDRDIQTTVIVGINPNYPI